MPTNTSPISRKQMCLAYFPQYGPSNDDFEIREPLFDRIDIELIIAFLQGHQVGNYKKSTFLFDIC